MATSCPFCLLTFEDAVKISGSADQIVVKDIAELVAEAIHAV
jgi:Fe-S oxidoreductase